MLDYTEILREGQQLCVPKDIFGDSMDPDSGCKQINQPSLG